MKVQWFNLYYSVYFGIKTNDMIYFVPDTDLQTRFIVCMDAIGLIA